MLVFLVLAAYLLGSIPFGLIVGSVWNVDVRRHGSGNIGATNVFRTLGPVPGALVFALDFLKGAAAVWLGLAFSGEPVIVLLFGAAAIVGHMFPLFLKFKGGKGAATGLGVLAALAPEVFVISLLIAAVIIYATRYVSVGSMITPFAATGLMALFHKPLPYVIITLALAVLIVIRHRSNLKRLRLGTEPKI